MLPDIKVVVGEDVCDESAREFEERRDNAVGLTVVPESEDVVVEPVLSGMMGIAVPPCVELDMRCSTVVVPTSRAVDWVGVEETRVAVIFLVVQPQSTTAGAREKETGLDKARLGRRTTQSVTIPMGETLMVAVVNGFGRGDRGSRDPVLGRRKTLKDRSRTRLAR